MATLSVEMDDYSSKNYGKVHAAGCRDMRDEYPIGEVADMSTLLDAFNDATGWDYEDTNDVEIAPCARKALA